MKHAYLIMAHNNPYTLESLIKLIDDERNDIYLHIDIKASLDIEHIISIPQKSKIFLKERLNGAWAQMITPKYILMNAAYSKGYDYYHLLSGVDLPIKTQDYIHDFFEKNKGKEFVGFKPDEFFDKSWIEKIYLFPNEFRTNNKFKKYLRLIFLKIQSLLNYKYRKDTKECQYKKGPEWFSITHDLMKILIKYENQIKETYKYSYLKDEQFIQTVLFNSHLRNNIFAYEQDQLYACMRYVSWKEGTKEFSMGSPSSITIEDIETIIQSDRLFARKFSDDNKDAIDYVLHYHSCNDK